MRRERRVGVRPFLVRLLALAATLLAAATGLAFGARVWWVFELLTHFRVHYVMGGLLLLAPAAALRAHRWALVIAVCVVLNAVPIAAYFPRPMPLAASSAGAAAASAGARPVRVLAANLSRYDYASKGLLAIVDAETPDVLLLVEFTNVTDERFRALDERYPYRLKAPRHDAFGLALYSKHPMDAKEIEIVHTAAIRARVSTPSGELTVFGVHLRSPTGRSRALARNAQLDELVTLTSAESAPVVVIGDYNVTAYSPYFSRWLAASGLRDAGAGRGFWSSWPTSLPMMGIPIDHCAVSPEIEVVDHRRLPAFGSDHYPVIAQLRLP